MGPYEIKPISGILIRTGERTTIQVPFPSRTYITKLFVKQYAGTPREFTVELFNHRDALEGTEQSSSYSDGDQFGPIPLEMYRVAPLLTSAVPGTLEHFFDMGGAGYCFYSQDPADNGRQGVNKRTLYVRITVTGSPGQDCLFSMVIGCDDQAG